MLMVLWSCDWILSPTLADRYLDSAVVARWILDTKHWRWKSSHQVIQLNLGIAVCGLLLPPRLCLKGDSSNSGSRAASERKSHKTPDMMIYVIIHYIDLYNSYSTATYLYVFIFKRHCSSHVNAYNLIVCHHVFSSFGPSWNSLFWSTSPGLQADGTFKATCSGCSNGLEGLEGLLRSFSPPWGKKSTTKALVGKVEVTR